MFNKLCNPYDVLVDMLKGYVPSGANDLEENRLHKEMERRKGENRYEDKPAPE